MSCITHTRHILLRDGTNQLERLPDALKPDFINVDERSRMDLMKFIQAFSEQVQYYDTSNNRDGDWTDFFNDFNRDHEPLIALMLTFLELFRKAQDHINEMTRRHLEFYYKKVLQIKDHPAEPDHVNILVELAKGVQSFRLEKGTLLQAGKDQSKKDLYYKTEKEIVLNKASVECFKTIFIDKTLDNRVYSAPMANAADGIAKPLEGNEPKWYTFGCSQSGLNPSEQCMTESEIGFAVASSLLMMKEGKRSVTLTFRFDQLNTASGLTLSSILNGNFSQSFQAWFSSEKKWLGPFDVSVTKSIDNKGLEMMIVCGAENPAIISCSNSLPGNRFDTSLPVLRVLINREKQPYPYHLLQWLNVLSANLKVTVEGVQDLVLQNEMGIIDVSTPIMPFGTRPVVGSLFYIGNEEILSKKPEQIEICYKWKELPPTPFGFDTYYNSYIKSYDTNKFLCKVAVLQDKEWILSSKPESLKLFDLITVTVNHKKKQKKRKIFKPGLKGKDLRSSETADVMNSVSGAEYTYENYHSAAHTVEKLDTGEIRRIINMNDFSLKHHVDNFPVKKFDSTVNNGFLRLELVSQDFGHGEYPMVLAKTMMELSKFIADNSTAEGGPVPPNEPYTPRLEYLKINYSSSQELRPQSFSPVNGVSRIYHIEPFGVREIHSIPAGEGINLFPWFSDEGYLFVGIKDLIPRQTLSLLFQVAESSSVSGTFVDPEEINWCYLSEERWVQFNSQEILTDSTNGLLTSGIISFDIPGAATNNHLIMPSGLHWIRVSVPRNAMGANQMINITAQAVMAVFTDKDNDPCHLQASLAAGSITKLANQKPEVKKIIQPYASFGGRMAEGSDPFYKPYYTRVSERLRHKNRAITIWDMERMVLEQFPGIYKVKCLNHSSDKTDIAPGHITMVVIENIRNKNAVNPLQPKTSNINLNRIGKFLEKYVSPFVAVHIQNPVYEEILVDFKVYFHPGFDAGFYKQQLNEEIRKFLSPWAYVEGEDIMFGNTIYKSSILNFIEEREYVDYLTDFKMFHITKSWGIGCMEIEDDFVVGSQEISIDEEQVEAKTSRSILVSAVNHSIYVLGADEYTCEGIKK